ncbi:hypothetical protein [Sphingomonas sp. ABOLF]|uniref:hypothetical protein n=1 Tax=Sphingomonas sp. ABOLF TaxID=1985879 RepID=UPI0013E02014|nr:hypothetical protein [Sphingomonas sp. ABOLF]
MSVRVVLKGAMAVAAVAVAVVPAGHALGCAAIALSDAVAPRGDVSPVHHDDRNIR